MADLIRFLLTTSFSLVTLAVIIWADVNLNLSTDCGPKSLCRNQFPADPGGYPDWNTTTAAIDSTMSCRCDPECGHYDDCCPDAARIYGLHPASTTWKCLQVTTDLEGYAFSTKYYMYMIGTCPGSDDLSLVESCQRDNNLAPYSHLMDVPVLSLVTNRTYANVYCAECHSDSKRLATWNMSIECDKDFYNYNVSGEEMFHEKNYLPGKRKWTLRVDELTINCVIVIQEFYHATDYIKSTGGRRCVPKTDDCPFDWTESAGGYMCDIYTIDTEKSPSEVFNDPNCAQCHHGYTTTCLEQTPSVIDQYPLGRRKSYSFSMLVDFNFGGYYVDSRERCASNEIFDHLHEKCHVVSCGARFVKQSGKCVARSTSKQDEPNGAFDSPCPRLNLIANEDFYWVANGTFILNKTSKIFRPGSYELNSNGTVQICASQLRPSYLETLKNYLKYSYAQRLLSDTCLTISVICLALHIAIHILVPKLRNLPGKILLSLSCALFTGQLLFLTSVGALDMIGYGPCAALAAMIHWSILAAFFWMNVMAFDICRTFAGCQVNANRHRASTVGRRRSFRFYSIYGWTCPTLIVGIAILLDFTNITNGALAPDYGINQCWICNKNGLGVFFVLPMALLLTANLIFFGLTAGSIFKQWRESQFGRKKLRRSIHGSDKQKFNDQIAQQRQNKTLSRLYARFYLYIKLALIMGLGWISAFAAGLGDIPALWYPFILLNTLQGTFIFLAFDCKRKVYYMLYEVITKKPHPSNTWSSTRGNPTSHPMIRRSTSTTPQEAS